MAFGELTAADFFASWQAKAGIHSLAEVDEWVSRRNKTVAVAINKITLDDCSGWALYEDEGVIRNDAGSFFQVAGMRAFVDGGGVVEQPVLLQNEIGYLGILCAKFNGVLHVLMQAKIEPGNVNCVQLSPTIQATKSNFTQAHKGAVPAYLEWFRDANPANVVVDLLQSEQGSRFLEKRNRNIMVYTDQPVEVLPSHCWMTLGQVAHYMQQDNMVNMDARTVLSCIPYDILPRGNEHDWPEGQVLSASPNWDEYEQAVRLINDHKMFSVGRRELVSLTELQDWEITQEDIHCVYDYPYRVVFCDIDIEGREVRHWCQPLFEAQGKAFFGLLGRKGEQGLEFLVRLAPEIGAFDSVELGPTVQREAHATNEPSDMDVYFFSLLEQGDAIVDVLQSEEGGRFYHEENRNVIIIADVAALDAPQGFVWCSYMTLVRLCQERYVNIQLRNVLSLLGVVFANA